MSTRTSSLISIIIPTYNRGHLIGETLDSIIAQTYVHWEAWVVDDGSNDDSDAILQAYQKKDDRINYLKRPLSGPKGGNVCRNIGLDQATGAYIVFFDSDDLMTTDHLETKIEGMQDPATDFVITKTKYFNAPDTIAEHEYHFEQPISLKNFLTRKIHWLTLDSCIKADKLEHIRFNEKLKAGQEYNFYAKLLVVTTAGVCIDKMVSLRRYHEQSIQSKLHTQKAKNVSSFLSRWATYKEIQQSLTSSEKKALLIRCVKNVYWEKRVPAPHTWSMIRTMFKVYGGKGIHFVIMLVLLKFNKGYQSRKTLEKLSAS